MVNGNAGDVKLKKSGVGSTILARANTESVLGPEEMRNACNVISSEREGKGILWPGKGRPGIGGTMEALVRLRLFFSNATLTLHTDSFFYIRMLLFEVSPPAIIV